jgi:hypothetical protein
MANRADSTDPADLADRLPVDTGGNVKPSDAKLVEQIHELRGTAADAERELGLATAEYRRRRLARVQEGQPAELAGEEGALVGQTRLDALRREQLCASNRELDLEARRSPLTKSLFG